MGVGLEIGILSPIPVRVGWRWVVGCWVVCGWFGGLGAGAVAAERPNIVLILADDLGYGDLGVYGQRKIATPELDRMAAEGLRFTDFYAASPICRPSRYSLLTGRHQGRAFVRDNREGVQAVLRDEDLTIARLLQRDGYATGGFGKWGLGGADSSGSPDRQGFDRWFGYLDQARAHRHHVDHLWRDGERVAVDRDAYSHDLIFDEALDFVRAHREEPFFLYLAVTLPHADLDVPQDSLAPYLGAFEEVPFTSRSPLAHGYTPQPTPRAAYAGMVSRLDRDVGRLLRLLGELGIDERTAVFFTSDNGPSPGGGSDPAFFDSAGGLRGVKRELYEGGIRVPLIVRWPGRVPAGATTGAVAAGWDLPATFGELAGAGPPPEGDGISLVPVLVQSASVEREALYFESHAQGFQQALRSGRWKLIREGDDARPRLYDLEADPGETRDLAADHPPIVERLVALMEAEREDWPFDRGPRGAVLLDAPRGLLVGAVGAAVALLLLGARLLARRRSGTRVRPDV